MKPNAFRVVQRLGPLLASMHTCIRHEKTLLVIIIVRSVLHKCLIDVVEKPLAIFVHVRCVFVGEFLYLFIFRYSVFWLKTTATSQQRMISNKYRVLRVHEGMETAM